MDDYIKRMPKPSHRDKLLDPLKQQPQLVPRLEAAPSAHTFGMALAASAPVPDPDASFMLRVEQAVDRVLSRSDWPRPTAQGSRIVSRKPNPEEGN